MAATLLVGLITACGDSGASGAEDADPSPPSASPSASAGDARVLGTVDAGGSGFAMTVSDQAVWIQVDGVGVARIDPVTGETTATVPDTTNSLLVDGELWAVTGEQQQLLVVDPVTAAVTSTIDLPSPAYYLTADDTAVWLLSDAGLLRVDRAARALTATYPFAPCEAKELDAAFGAVWVACKEGEVRRIDPADGTVTATIETGDGAHSFAHTDDALWVTNYRAGTVSRIDPASNTVAATVADVGYTVGIGEVDGRIWAGAYDAVAILDPDTNAVEDRVELPHSTYYYDMAPIGDEVWVSTGTAVVHRIARSATGRR